MVDNGITEDSIKIVSRGKLDAVAPVTDLVDAERRNAQFMIPSRRGMIPPDEAPADIDRHKFRKISTSWKKKERGEPVRSPRGIHGKRKGIPYPR
jgi:hypothetical protein